MTHRLVVDCPCIMADFLPDEKQASMEEIAAHDIYVPSLFYLECGNVLSGALKKKRITEKDFTDYLRILPHLPVTGDQFCTTPESLYTLAKLCKNLILLLMMEVI